MISRIRAFAKRPFVAPLLALFAVYLLFLAWTPDTFGRAANLTTMARQTVVTGIAAIGMTLVLFQGGIDLSAGSALALLTVVGARALQSGTGPILTAILMIGGGGVLGAVNGATITGLRISPFLATLSTMTVFRGIARGLADEQKIDCDTRGIETLMTLSPERSWMIFPVGVWSTLVCAVFAAGLVHFTRLGRHLVAIGSNERTALLAGIRVDRTKLAGYAISGLFLGLASLFELSTLTVGDPTDAFGLELSAIASAVIGGGSLTGGQASVLGSLFGALLMTVIRTGCTHVGLPNWVQEILTGGIILVAMTADRLRRREGFSPVS